MIQLETKSGVITVVELQKFLSIVNPNSSIMIDNHCDGYEFLLYENYPSEASNDSAKS